MPRLSRSSRSICRSLDRSPNPEFSCAIIVSILFCNRSGPEFSDYKIQYDHLIPIEEINMTSNFDVTCYVTCYVMISTATANDL